jgi:hypothetical protein
MKIIESMLVSAVVTVIAIACGAPHPVFVGTGVAVLFDFLVAEIRNAGRRERLPQ